MNKEKNLFEQMGGTYSQVEDYLIPDIRCQSDEQVEILGKYGLLRKHYLKEHHKGRYQCLLLQGKLSEHLFEVDSTARKREELILKQLEEKNPLPDKIADQMAWVQAANQHRMHAEEIVLSELIYV